MPRFIPCAAALALSIALAPIAAHAATMDTFTFNSPEISGPLTATIAASPTPTSSVPGVSFDLSNVSASFEGNTFTGDVTAGGAGGGGTDFSGPLLFSGAVTDPTFLLGNFNLSGMADLGNGGVQSVTGVLTISQSSSAPVPEPLPLALTATGLIGLLGIVRLRRPEMHNANVRC
jgi:hypothetical protein